MLITVSEGSPPSSGTWGFQSICDGRVLEVFVVVLFGSFPPLSLQPRQRKNSLSPLSAYSFSKVDGVPKSESINNLQKTRLSCRRLIWLVSTPFFPSVSSTSDTERVKKRDNLLTGEGGKWWGPWWVSEILRQRQRESLVSFKSFNTLWPESSNSKKPGILPFLFPRGAVQPS
jgi:hypothetical protein